MRDHVLQILQVLGNTTLSHSQQFPVKYNLYPK